MCIMGSNLYPPAVQHLFVIMLVLDKLEVLFSFCVLQFSF